MGKLFSVTTEAAAAAAAEAGFVPSHHRCDRFPDRLTPSLISHASCSQRVTHSILPSQIQRAILWCRR